MVVGQYMHAFHACCWLLHVVVESRNVDRELKYFGHDWTDTEQRMNDFRMCM